MLIDVQMRNANLEHPIFPYDGQAAPPTIETFPAATN